jgi:hypothetical protein
MESSNGRPDARVGQRIAAKLSSTRYSIDSQETPADQSTPPRTRMPRECPPAFRSAPQSPKLTQPSEGPFDHPRHRPIRCHIRCCASRAQAQCGWHADLAGLTQHHNHGRLVRSQDDGVANGQNHEHKLIGFMRFRGKQKLHAEIADECQAAWLLAGSRASSGHEQKND